MNGGSSSNITKNYLSPTTLFTINGNVVFKSVYVTDITDADQGISQGTLFIKKKTLHFIYPNMNIGDEYVDYYNRQYIIKIDYTNGPTKQINLNDIYIGASIDISFNNESHIIIKISQPISYISYKQNEVAVSEIQSSTNDIITSMTTDGSITGLKMITPHDYIIKCNDDDAIKYNNTLDLVKCKIHYTDNALPDEYVTIIPGFMYHIGPVLWGYDDEEESHVVGPQDESPYQSSMPSTRSRRPRRERYVDPSSHDNTLVRDDDTTRNRGRLPTLPLSDRDQYVGVTPVRTYDIYD